MSKVACVTRCWAFVVWVWVPVRGSLCLFWRETHTKGLRARFPTSPEEDEGRKVPERKKGVRRRNQNREGSRTDQLREQGSRQKSGEADGRERPPLEPIDWDAGLANVKRWVSILCSFVGISLEYTLTRAHRILGKYHKLLPFALGANPSPWLFVLLFLHPLSCVCHVSCVRKESWNTIGRRWEKPLDDLMAICGLRVWDSGGRPVVYCQTCILE